MKKILPIIIAVVITAVASSGITYFVTVEMLDKPSDKNESSYSEDVDGGSTSKTGYELEVIDESVVGSSSQNKFEIKSAVVDKDHNGKDVVLVTVVYSRLSGEAENLHTVSKTYLNFVYQNGVALSHTYVSALEEKYNFDSNAHNNDVKAGYSVVCTEIFELKDRNADLVVEIEESPYYGAGNYTVSKTFKMK